MHILETEGGAREGGGYLKIQSWQQDERGYIS